MTIKRIFSVSLLLPAVLLSACDFSEDGASSYDLPFVDPGYEESIADDLAAAEFDADEDGLDSATFAVESDRPDYRPPTRSKYRNRRHCKYPNRRQECTEAFEVGLDGLGAIVSERYGVKAHVPRTNQYGVLLTLREGQEDGTIVNLGRQGERLGEATLLGEDGPNGFAVFEATWDALPLQGASSLEACTQLWRQFSIKVPYWHRHRRKYRTIKIWRPLEQMQCAVIEPASA